MNSNMIAKYEGTKQLATELDLGWLEPIPDFKGPETPRRSRAPKRFR